MFKYWNYCGLLNKTGLVIVLAVYKEIGYFSEGLCVVWDQNGLAGFVNETGELIIKCEFSIEGYSVKEASFHEGLVKIEEDGLYGFLNKKGEIVLPFKYSSAGHFSNELAPVSEYIQVDEYNYEYVYGYIDQKGEYLFDGFFSAEGFSEDWAVINGDSYLSLSGDVVPGFAEAKSFSEVMGRVRLGSRWGFINKNGKLAVNLVYNDAKNFSEGLAAVESGGKWGYINKTGGLVIQHQFDLAYSFVNGCAVVGVETDYSDVIIGEDLLMDHGIIDVNGDWVFYPARLELRNVSDGMFGIDKEEHHHELTGYIDAKMGKLFYFRD